MGKRRKAIRWLAAIVIVSKDEWLYFLECLEGRREYNIEDKMRITTKPSHRQA